MKNYINLLLKVLRIVRLIKSSPLLEDFVNKVIIFEKLLHFI